MAGKQGCAECTHRTTARDVFHFEPSEIQGSLSFIARLAAGP